MSDVAACEIWTSKGYEGFGLAAARRAGGGSSRSVEPRPSICRIAATRSPRIRRRAIRAWRAASLSCRANFAESFMRSTVRKEAAGSQQSW